MFDKRKQYIFVVSYFNSKTGQPGTELFDKENAAQEFYKQCGDIPKLLSLQEVKK